MATDRVIVNAGGRRFETTTTTLLSSGSAYFSALLGPTGSALGSLAAAAATNNEESTATSTAVTPHGRKRARNDDEEESNHLAPSALSEAAPAAKEIFVDRDSDLFADVLFFMRSAKLPAKSRQDVARLEDLKSEALVFGHDGLASACDEALKEIQAAVEEALKPEPQPKAICRGYIVEAGQSTRIDVPENQVLFIASATLAGRVSVRRYEPSEKQVRKRRESEDAEEANDTSAYSGCYIDTCEQTDTGDFQLKANLGANHNVTIAHVGIDHFRVGSEAGLNVDFRQDIRQCLAPNDEYLRRIHLRSEGSGDWHVIAWIGDPAAIPDLSHKVDRSNENKRRRLDATVNTSRTNATGTLAARAAALATMSATNTLLMGVCALQLLGAFASR